MEEIQYLCKKIPIRAFLMLMGLVPLTIQAQSVKRQCVSSYCTIVNANYASLEQTAGQPFNTTISYGQKTSILPGFQQTLVFTKASAEPYLMNDLKIIVYPNPATHSIVIQTPEALNKPVISVYDINGKVVWLDTPEEFVTYPINCESWSDGMYILKISDKNLNIYSTKLIINK